jgi:ribonuclease R
MKPSQTNEQSDRERLQKIARQAMVENGLLPEFSPAVLYELEKVQALPLTMNDGAIRDLRNLLWASIDNDDSFDLDQLTTAETLPGNKVKIYVAIADVDSLVKKGSAIDEHALHNTTSVYTAAEIFPMLPERLSTELTSLGLNEERPAVVIEMVIGADGALQDSAIYQAWVQNHAKLAYSSIGAWLEGNGPIPEAVKIVDSLEENLRTQDRAAQSMRNFRHIHGALSLETIEARPIFDGEQIRDLQVEEKNRAMDIIEDFMITANGVTVRYLLSKRFPSIRRVVRVPRRWDQIVALAKEHGYKLPEIPDSKALDGFLIKQKAADPLRFPDLSLSVIKLLGSGEYVAEKPGEPVPGHFGLAVKDYAHSTAPNRRFPDLVTQRLLKAAIEGQPVPYTFDELGRMAQHFTTQEDAATKVERLVGDSAAALLLEPKIGQQFDALVTGSSAIGTWVRLLEIPVEGRLMRGFGQLNSGDQVRVQLVSVNVERGFIDFKKVGKRRR